MAALDIDRRVNICQPNVQKRPVFKAAEPENRDIPRDTQAGTAQAVGDTDRDNTVITQQRNSCQRSPGLRGSISDCYEQRAT